ncbi:hypothetical protein, partial [Lactococcus cremoris]
IEEFCTLFQTFSFLLYLFQVLFFKLKAGNECLCAGTEYSWTLRSLRHPPALTKYETTAQDGFA